VDELTFVEVLGRTGEVVHRIPISSLPVTVGRAYDNDVILDDPYVAPHHLRIELRSDGALRAVDLDSRNGLYAGRSMKPVKEALLDPDARIRIGHTRLRVRSRSFNVPAERPQIHWPWLQDVRVFVAAVLITAIVALVEAYAGEHERYDTIKLLFPPFFFVAGGLVWAGAWAFFSKVLTGRANFIAHGSIAIVGLLAIEMTDVLGGYLAFALSMRAMQPAAVVGMGLVFAAMLYAHLSLISRHAPRFLAGVAVGIAALLFGAGWGFVYIQEPNDSTSMPYVTQLKAPFFRIAPEHSPEQFLAGAQALKGKLDALRKD
jgi:FHA domain